MSRAARRRAVTGAMTGAGLAALLLLAACQSPKPGPGGLEVSASEGAGPAMNRVLAEATTCWFKSGERAFSPYRLSSELDSYSGRPRLLMVPRDTPEVRPLAVIQAQGTPARIEVFGPLLNQPVGNRIASDVRRWAAGGTGCGGAA